MKASKSFHPLALAILTLLLVSLISCTEQKKKTVVFWGDSLTAPHTGYGIKEYGIKRTIKKIILGDSSYPGVFDNLMGDGYEIINCGVGGENTLTIAARQGSIPMFLAHDIILFPDRSEKFIGNEDVKAFLSTWDSTSVTPLLQCEWNEGSPGHINPCKIQKTPCIIKCNNSYFVKEDDGFHFRWTYLIEGCNEETTYDTLKAGSIVYTDASKSLRAPYANVFFIGQNGGFKNIADLIAQYKRMIAYGKTNRYIVISFHKPNSPVPTIKRMKEMEDSLHTAFGKHFINLRGYLVKNGLKDAELTPTKVDKDSISNGQVPPQLLKDGVHFTSKGYKLIAKLVQKKFNELGY